MQLADSLKSNSYSQLATVDNPEMDVEMSRKSSSKPSLTRKSVRLNSPYARVETLVQTETHSIALLVKENNSLRKEIADINEKLSQMMDTFNKTIAEKDEIIKNLMAKIILPSTTTITSTTQPPLVPSPPPSSPSKVSWNEVVVIKPTPSSPTSPESPIKKRPKLSIDQIKDLIAGKQIQFGIRSERIYIIGWKKCPAFMIRTSMNAIGIQTGKIFNVDFIEDELLELIVDSRISELIENKLKEHFSQTLSIFKGDILDPEFFAQIYNVHPSPKEIAELINERNKMHLARDTLPLLAKRYFLWHQKQIAEQIKTNSYLKISKPIQLKEFIPMNNDQQ